MASTSLIDGITHQRVKELRGQLMARTTDMDTRTVWGRPRNQCDLEQLIPTPLVTRLRRQVDQICGLCTAMERGEHADVATHLNTLLLELHTKLQDYLVECQILTATDDRAGFGMKENVVPKPPKSSAIIMTTTPSPPPQRPPQVIRAIAHFPTRHMLAFDHDDDIDAISETTATRSCPHPPQHASHIHSHSNSSSSSSSSLALSEAAVPVPFLHSQQPPTKARHVCGQPTQSNGRPCQRRVEQAGMRCHHHHRIQAPIQAPIQQQQPQQPPQDERLSSMSLSSRDQGQGGSGGESETATTFCRALTAKGAPCKRKPPTGGMFLLATQARGRDLRFRDLLP